MGAQCNGCGGCCNPVALTYRPIDVLTGKVLHLTDADRRWVLEDLTPISRREGLERSPHMSQGGRTAYLHEGEPVLLWTHFYECRHYDPETRQCMNYDNRPDICSGYPWFDMPPEPNLALPLECSFREDIGQPVVIRSADG